MGKLGGRVVFITGAARGQGRAHALRFADEGADVIGIDVCGPAGGNSPPASEADLHETERLVQARGRRVLVRQADVRDLPQLQAVLDEGVAYLGRLDIAVANAGINGSGRKTWEMSPAQWNVMLETNLTGVWQTCVAAVPKIRAGERGGAVLLTSSVAGVKGIPNAAAYTAAKHGVLGLMRALAIELAPERIRVNAVLPTNVDTPMIDHPAMYRLFRPDLENPTKDDFAQAARKINLLPVPWVEAEDVANAAVWLASDEARYVTGVALPIDAGAGLR